MIVLAFVFGWFAEISAQCVPNLTGVEFVAVPDTIENLPVAYAPGPYEATIQMWIPTDTFVPMLNLVLPLDSLFITGIGGLPISFEYAVYPSAGPIPGGSSVCLQITNAYIEEEVYGVHPLFVHVTAWSVGIPANGDMTGYVLRVEPPAVGVEEVERSSILLNSLVSDRIHVRNTTYNSSYRISDISGRIVASGTVNGPIDASGLKAGVYWFATDDATTRFVKQ